MARKKEHKKEVPFINPFDTGVSYAAFLNSIPEGVSIESHLKDKLTKEEIEFIKSEINQLK